MYQLQNITVACKTKGNNSRLLYTACCFCYLSRCYIALKRNHDNQKEAAAFLRKMMRGELTAKNGFQAVADNGATNTKQKPDENVVKEAGEVTQELGK